MHIIKSIWRPNPTIKYIGENRNIKFSPTSCKYFTVAELDTISGIYDQYFHTNIGNISSRFGGSRDGCMIVCEFDVFYNVIHSNKVKHGTKYRGIDQHLLGLCKL